MSEHSIKLMWERMQGDKSDLVTRCEKYSRWTIRGICPEDSTEDQARVPSYVLVGPRLINNLSNKIVEIMFPYTRPFFSVRLSSGMRQKIREEVGDEELAAISSEARKEARFLEDFAMEKLNLVAYRPIAVAAAQHIIVTGNALVRRLPNGKRVVYGIKDFGVIRSMDGDELEVVVRDYLVEEELTDVQRELVSKTKTETYNAPASTTGARPKSMGLELLTRWTYKEGRVIQTQELEGIELPNRMGFAKRDKPFIVLTWALNRGDNYARGLVEEHENVFHNLDVTTEAIIDIFNLMADIKFLVRPGSVTAGSLKELNSRRRGAYIPGQEGDITAIELQKARDLQVLTAAGERMERELGFVFLLGSGTVRDAERVTALEVQIGALELEQAFGGLYSRLALTWQQQEAEYLIGQLKIPNIGKQQMFDVRVTTGLETLSREGELARFREALADLQMFNTVPEDMRMDINPRKVSEFLFGQRGVRFEEFLYTQEEKDAISQANQQALVQEQALATEGAMVEGSMRQQ